MPQFAQNLMPPIRYAQSPFMANKTRRKGLLGGNGSNYRMKNISNPNYQELSFTSAYNPFNCQTGTSEEITKWPNTSLAPPNLLP